MMDAPLFLFFKLPSISPKKPLMRHFVCLFTLVHVFTLLNYCKYVFTGAVDVCDDCVANKVHRRLFSRNAANMSTQGSTESYSDSQGTSNPSTTASYSSGTASDAVGQSAASSLMANEPIRDTNYVPSPILNAALHYHVNDYHQFMDNFPLVSSSNTSTTDHTNRTVNSSAVNASDAVSKK